MKGKKEEEEGNSCMKLRVDMDAWGYKVNTIILYMYKILKIRK